MRSRSISLVIRVTAAVVAVAVPLVLDASSAIATTCLSGHFRAGDDSDVTTSVGVRGNLQIGTADQIGGIARRSAGRV